MVIKLILSFIVIICSVFSYTYYLFEIKEYDVADENVEEVIESEFDISLLLEETEDNEQTGNKKEVENLDNNSTEQMKEDAEDKRNESGDIEGKVEEDVEDETETNTINDSEAQGSEEENDAPKESEQSNASKPTSKPVKKEVEKDKTEPKKKEAVVEEEKEAPKEKEVVGEKEKEKEKPKEKEVVAEKEKVEKEALTDEEKVQTILNRYMPPFERLQTQANERLNSLISLAINEFNEKRKKGEDISFSYFYSKYSLAAERLEEKTDVTFFVLYSMVEDDLEKSNLSKKEAKVFKEHYLQAKIDLRAQILDRAKKELLE